MIGKMHGGCLGDQINNYEPTTTAAVFRHFGAGGGVLPVMAYINERVGFSLVDVYEKAQVG